MATKGQKQVIRTEKEKYEIIKPVLENFKSQTQVLKETVINVGLIFQWIKKYNEKVMRIDFDKNNYNTVQDFIDDIVWDNNNYRPSFALQYKNLVEYRTQLGFK